MIDGFQSRFVESICDQDGRNWKLLTPVVYKSRDGRVFVIPCGASTDGASTPALISNLLPPTGAYWQSAVLHDAAYQDTLLVWPLGLIPTLPISHEMAVTLQRASLSKDECDLLLKEAMELSGVDAITVETIYEGVRLGGASAFKEDRS
jgi:hypothetical protein